MPLSKIDFFDSACEVQGRSHGSLNLTYLLDPPRIGNQMGSKQKKIQKKKFNLIFFFFGGNLASTYFCFWNPFFVGGGKLQRHLQSPGGNHSESLLLLRKEALLDGLLAEGLPADQLQ